MNNRRKLVVALSGAALAVPIRAFAQPSAKIPRIAILAGSSSTGESPRVEAFRQGLRDLDYVEGKNIALEYRYADARFDRLPALADELIRLKVDVLVCSTTPAVRAARNATRTIPIVFFGVYDPVAAGMVDRQPGAAWRKRHGIHQHCDDIGRQTTGTAQGDRSKPRPCCGAVRSEVSRVRTPMERKPRTSTRFGFATSFDSSKQRRQTRSCIRRSNQDAL